METSKIKITSFFTVFFTKETLTFSAENLAVNCILLERERERERERETLPYNSRA
jgi:hypothetical protein